MEDLTLLTLYFSAWMWHISALIFLCFGISMASSIFPVGIMFIMMYVIAEIIAIFRQSKLKGEKNEYTD